MNVRGVYTSDIAYQVHSLHKDMQFKIPKDQDWFSQYNWVQYPGEEQGEPGPERPKEEEAKAEAGTAAGARKPAATAKKAQSKQNTASKKIGLGGRGAKTAQKGLSTAKSQKSVRFEE